MSEKKPFDVRSETDRVLSKRAPWRAEKHIPTPKIQISLDPDTVSTGVISGPMGEYYGTLRNSSPEFRLRLMKAMNSFDKVLKILNQIEAHLSLNMATTPPLETTQKLLVDVRKLLEEVR